MTEKLNNMEALLNIQQAIKSTKDQRNDFGKFNYRSAEGIYSAVKPLLKEHNLVLIINDELQEMGGNIYIVAKASLYNFESDKPFITVSGYAKEAVSKKGMSSEQVTGSASSYARKYALGGLFLLDDNKDP
ncbi:MAG: ERF family protein, partial [archaeon]|nr:ERF family protein [archaeon]